MSIRHGLPYGWWKSADLWAVTICAPVLFLMIAGPVWAWWLA